MDKYNYGNNFVYMNASLHIVHEICVMLAQVMLSCGKYNLVHEFFRKLQKSSVPNSLTYRGILIYFISMVNCHSLNFYNLDLPVMWSSCKYTVERGKKRWGYIGCPRNGKSWNCRLGFPLLWSGSMPLCSWKKSRGTKAGAFCYSYSLTVVFWIG